MNTGSVAGAALLLLALQPSFGSERDSVIVTATRTVQTADETLASVTILTRDTIERQQARSIEDLLRGLPGISVANNGGAGKATSLFLRGAEADHLVVLIDGIRVGSASLGTAALQDFPLEQIDRIEIVRGPRSSLYGSEAVGGVVQLFTRTGRGAFKPFFSIGRGAYGTHSASAGVSGGSDRAWYSVNASGIDTEGFNACEGRPSPDGAGCFTFEPDKDGYRNLAGGLRAGYRFDNGLELETHVLHADSSNEFDGSFVNESESVQQVVGGALRFSPVSTWQSSLTAGRSRDESDNFKDGTFQSRFDTERDTASFQNDISVGAHHLLSLGLDYEDERVDGTTDYVATTRDNTGLFAQYQGTLASHEVHVSLRRDENEQFGARSTGGVAWGHALGAGVRLTAAYGTAFKGPTFNELYFPGFGNPDLRPEDSQSIEIGLSGPGPVRWSVNAYETRVDDLIAFDASTFAPANIDQARIRGIEAVLSAQLGGWNLSTNLTLLDPENRSPGANHGNVLPRRVRQSLRADLDREFGPYHLGATLHVAGHRYDDLANTLRLGSYATFDLRGEVMLRSSWRLQARIENLFDKAYSTAAFFNQPGRGLYVTLRYQP